MVIFATKKNQHALCLGTDVYISMSEENKIVVANEDELFERISGLIEENRRRVAKAINTAMVYTYYGIGQYIVEFEQRGEYRAA